MSILKLVDNIKEIRVTAQEGIIPEQYKNKTIVHTGFVHANHQLLLLAENADNCKHKVEVEFLNGLVVKLTCIVDHKDYMLGRYDSVAQTTNELVHGVEFHADVMQQGENSVYYHIFNTEKYNMEYELSREILNKCGFTF